MNFRSRNGRRLSTRRLKFVLAAGALVLAVPLVAFAARSAPWPSGGHDLSNSHSNPDLNKPNASSVQNLAVKWTATVHGDVSAIAAVVDGAVYVPDWGGYLNKLNADTGATIWSRTIGSYTGVPGDVARAAPAVVGNTIYIGDQGAPAAGGSSVNGGWLLAINATSGNLIWKNQVDTHVNAILTAGPLVSNGVVYQGVASSEEAAASNPGDPCCTFRGSEVAVNASTGTTIWKRYTVPPNSGPCTSGNTGCGYSGGGVWGTTPAVDPATNTLFVTTGNNYTQPDGVTTVAPDDYIDSIMALNASTGAVKWATPVETSDDWNVACIQGNAANCPPNPGPDYDFGSGPNLFTATIGGHDKLVVGAGQKSGIYWALDAATGNVLWHTQAGPGSSLGGIEWGPATDGKRIYVAEENFYGIPHTMSNGQSVTSGSWAALDPGDGHIIWQVADPSHNAFGGGNALGPLSVANGVVYAPSMSGTMRALDASTGQTLWSYQAAGSVIAGATLSDGQVYWGSGYTHLGPFLGWTGSTTFYDFSLNGNGN